ncbi:DNA mismatch repair endonuclease MutL [Desulfitobacterium sp. Sab5]|uniref:DNA mismatch repair endonuclease MutL n=1 Tax=Desulfitobacterium nosdiversum TaxID=3375356 RepID=UPI003CEA5050
MNPRIQVLDPHSADQIAAGEVVERPVSVVKELVENSLDAGAKQIEITIEGNGVSLIRVHDDGSGISPEDLPQAVLRHATSKIRKIEDLDELQTLGFRGEALPSIASVSHLEIVSRPAESLIGMSLKLTGGKQDDLQEIGCPPGTTITVKDLFFNTPARRKFLKSINTEFGLISDMLGRIAMARPDVSFSLKHPKQIVFQTPGRGKLLESISSIYGQKLARQLIPLTISLDQYHLEGFISPPDLVRSTRQEETTIVNGRIIHSKLLSRAISDGYHTLIPNRLYPIIVLHLTLPPREYDVNVHPTKMEIRFQDEKILSQFITEQIRKTLLASRPIPSFERSSSYSEPSAIKPSQSKLFFPSLTRPELFKPQSQYPQNESSKLEIEKKPETQNTEQIVNTFRTKDINEIKDFTDRETSLDTYEIPEVDQPLEIHETSDAEEDSSILNDISVPVENPNMTSSITETVHPLLLLRPLGQVLNTYILAAADDALVIIDQHAAHERINYERLLKEHQHNPAASQTQLIPQPVDFSPIEEQALLDNLMSLSNMGFIIEHFGGRTYLIRGVPAYSGPYSGEELLRQFLDEVILKQNPPSFDELLREWIYMLACKESIKAKENLSLLEMQELIIQLSQTENPYTCPHGRPTIVKLTRSELEKRFYRT